MILKAGTYRFNDVLSTDGFVTEINELTSIQIKPFEVTADGETAVINTIYIPILGLNIINDQWQYMLYFGGEGFDRLPFYLSSDSGTTWYADVQTHTIITDTEVDDTSGTWYIVNTDYNEVNAKPLAEITYNGETIAQLNAGETATLSCKDKKMVSDVVISTNSEYKIPKLETAVVEPIPEVQIVKPSSSYDGFSQITVGAKTATPIEAGNATVMAMYLSSAEVGAIYKYTGTTDDTYENGSTYTVVEENGTKVYKKLVNDIGLGKVEHWRFKDVQTFMGETDDYYNFEGDGWCLVTIYGEFIINGSLCNRIKFEAYKIPNENLNFDTFTIWRQIHLGVFQRTSENSKLSEKPIRIYLENEGSITREEPYMGDFYILTGNRYPISIYQSDYDIAGIKETTTAEDWLSRVADRIS